MNYSISALANIFYIRCGLLKKADDSFQSLFNEWLEAHPGTDTDTQEQVKKELSEEMKSPNFQQELAELRRFRAENGYSGLFDELPKSKTNNDASIDTISDDGETDQQNKEITDWYANNPPAASNKNQPTAEPTRANFTETDANTIIQSFDAQIKNSLRSLKLLPCTITFIFYNNGNIGFVSNNVKAANKVRSSLLLDIQLALKHYLMSWKKSINVNSIKVIREFK